MSNIAIRVDRLSKQYRIGAKGVRHDTLSGQLAHSLRSLVSCNGRRSPVPGPGSSVPGPRSPVPGHPSTFWALKDISFEVKQGEVVGIIGSNGAGKSTLLKILSRITSPTSGRVELRGRVGSLLEVGTGFDRELTGRENIYLSGAILGMRKAEIDRKLDEIVDFSGVEKFIDTPVKRYSSGMFVRLAFAVAAHLEPDILIIDEVLAVGDVAFQRKCLRMMDTVAKEGRTVLFVSHNMATAQVLCSRGILLRLGSVSLDGSVDAVVREYLGYLVSTATDAFAHNLERNGTGGIRLTSARVLDELGQPTRLLVGGRPASFEYSYENVIGARLANISMTIFNHLGVAVTSFDFPLTNYVVDGLGGEGKFTCHVPSLPLPLGQYRIAVAIKLDGEDTDFIPNAIIFNVDTSTFFVSRRTPPIEYAACTIAHEWRHEIRKPSVQVR